MAYQLFFKSHCSCRTHPHTLPLATTPNNPPTGCFTPDSGYFPHSNHLFLGNYRLLFSGLISWVSPKLSIATPKTTKCYKCMDRCMLLLYPSQSFRKILPPVPMTTTYPVDEFDVNGLHCPGLLIADAPLFRSGLTPHHSRHEPSSKIREVTNQKRNQSNKLNKSQTDHPQLWLFLFSARSLLRKVQSLRLLAPSN